MCAYKQGKQQTQCHSKGTPAVGCFSYGSSFTTGVCLTHFRLFAFHPHPGTLRGGVACSTHEYTLWLLVHVPISSSKHQYTSKVSTTYSTCLKSNHSMRVVQHIPVCMIAFFSCHAYMYQSAASAKCLCARCIRPLMHSFGEASAVGAPAICKASLTLSIIITLWHALQCTAAA